MLGKYSLTGEQVLFQQALCRLPEWDAVIARIRADRYAWIVMNQDGEVRAFASPADSSQCGEPFWNPQYGLWLTRRGYGLSCCQLPRFYELNPAGCILQVASLASYPPASVACADLPSLPEIAAIDAWL